ncbi:MAG: T9SS type A sorting domain-containing protein [Bacteroidia bacterium]|nr:T9SS type A sorting domain-containing protein [Bacteroidia bacterium]
MAIRLTCIAFFISALTGYSQLNNLWLFGYANGSGAPLGGSRIDFISGSIDTMLDPRQLNFNATNAVISDNAGQLLFATNGIEVINAQQLTMLNGGGLNPGQIATTWATRGLPISQGALIIPVPSDSNSYYLFHMSAEFFGPTMSWIQPFNLFYSKINMTLDNGLGAVVQKNISAIHDTITLGEMTAVKHANGRDWWIVTHKFDSDQFLTVLVTPQGLTGPFRQAIGPNYVTGANGQVVFSQDGKRFARYDPTRGEDLDLFNFDRCTGLFSLVKHVSIPDSSGAGGVAFNRSGRFLYVTSITQIYQFDLDDPDWDLNYDTVAVYDGFYSPSYPFATTFLASYLAPDNKIYVTASNGVQAIATIDYPDSLGMSCSVCQHCVALPTVMAYTVPNYPNYNLGADSTSVCDTLLNIAFLPEFYEISVFPNPATSTIYIDCNSEYSIKIYNMLGYAVLIKPDITTDHALDISGLVPGFYIVEISVKGEYKKSVKILKL